MADRLDGSPPRGPVYDETGLRQFVIALNVARLAADRISGVPANVVIDMTNALNDIIAGAEELQRQ